MGCGVGWDRDVKSVQEHSKDIILAKFFEESSFDAYRLYCNRLKIINLNLSINYSEFSIQIPNPLVIHFKPSLIPKTFFDFVISLKC